MKRKIPTSLITGFDELPDSSFVRLNQLISSSVIPFSATTAWRRVREGTFPKPVCISSQVTAWRVGEIREWLKCPDKFVVNPKDSEQKDCKEYAQTAFNLAKDSRPKKNIQKGSES